MNIIERRKAIMPSLREFLNSPIGKECIEVLEYEMKTDCLKGKDPYETYYRLGGSDCIQLLKKLGEDDG